MARIISDGEMIDFPNMLEDNLSYMKPGDRKRIALIGAVEGHGGKENAFTGKQLEQIFSLGFAEKENAPEASTEPPAHK